MPSHDIKLPSAMEASISATPPEVKPTSTPKPNLKAHPKYALEYWMLRAMFDGDPDFKIGPIEDKTKSCKVAISTLKKAVLFAELVKFTDLTVSIDVNIETTSVTEEDVAALFSTNPHFSRFYTYSDSVLHYSAALFKPECISYFSDDMFSPTSHTAILPQDLAIKLLGRPDLNIKTDLVIDEF